MHHSGFLVHRDSDLHDEKLEAEVSRLLDASCVEAIQRSAFELVFGRPLPPQDRTRSCPWGRLRTIRALQEDIADESARLVAFDGAADLTLSWEVERGCVVREMAASVLSMIDSAVETLISKSSA